MHGSVSNPGRGLTHPRLYDAMLGFMTRGRERQYRERILDLAGVGPGHKVLDIGCGTGTLSRAAWRRVGPTGEIFGADASPQMLRYAEKRARRLPCGELLHFTVADAAALPFPGDRFDIVLMVTVMHMAPEAERATVLSEASRVLRPGGRLLVVDYGGPERIGLIARHHLHRSFEIDALRPQLEAMGFIERDRGVLSWLSLAYLLAERGGAHVAG